MESECGLCISKVIPRGIILALLAAVDVFVLQIVLYDDVCIVECTQVCFRLAKVLCHKPLLWIIHQEVIVINRTAFLVVLYRVSRVAQYTVVRVQIV